MASDPAELVQWVECSRCSKWRIIPPNPDGSHNDIPDIWFCEMNTDVMYSTCEAPEQEYKAPEPIVPLLIPQPVKRMPKLNDPESIRNRLKGLSNEELLAAYESIDVEKILADEFGGATRLELARSHELVTTDLPVDVSVKTGSKKSKTAAAPLKKIYDIDLMRKEMKLLVQEADQLLASNITSQIRR